MEIKENKECTYGEVVEEGERHHCDTLGAMLKFLKNNKVVDFEGVFLMYPMHKDKMVKLIGTLPDAN